MFSRAFRKFTRSRYVRQGLYVRSNYRKRISTNDSSCVSAAKTQLKNTIRSQGKDKQIGWQKLQWEKQAYLRGHWSMYVIQCFCVLDSIAIYRGTNSFFMEAVIGVAITSFILTRLKAGRQLENRANQLPCKRVMAT